jgi:hypothetical protein
VLQRTVERRQKAAEAREALRVELGSEGGIVLGSTYLSMKFSTAPDPRLWSPTDKVGFYKANSRTKIGRELKKKLTNPAFCDIDLMIFTMSLVELDETKRTENMEYVLTVQQMGIGYTWHLRKLFVLNSSSESPYSPSAGCRKLTEREYLDLSEKNIIPEGFTHA